MNYLIQASDQDLISEIKNNANTASANLSEIIERHSGIYLEIVNNYIPNDSCVVNKTDLIEDKSFHIYQAVLKYDPDRGTKFSTYLGNETKWMCLNLYNKNKKNIHVSLEPDQIDNVITQDHTSREVTSDLYRNIIKLSREHSDPRVQKIFYMRYELGHKNKVMPWQYIADKLEMSIQGCINIHNAAINKFKQKLIKE
tara:strand:- start:140 stop:733 length:594 start_codon:yes stop_codon:yes gene_type:complete